MAKVKLSDSLKSLLTQVDALSLEDVSALAAQMPQIKEKRAEEESKNNPQFQELKEEYKVLSKACNELTRKKFSVEINLPIVIKGEFDDYYSPENFDGGSTLTGKVELGKISSAVGLSRAQISLLRNEINSNFNEVCEDFITEFVPADFSQESEDLQKKCATWHAKLAKSGFEDIFFDSEE